ncbi:hypothetical protein Scep_029663 [Stephania cephalantha]|uniref:Uncharacterized protein n=1 Tax=Stephania cephalantha TaxID=152367 RepID=A0AAP0E2M3_9MAGN
MQDVKMFTIFMVQLQAHIRVLESTFFENRAALLMGLEYLIGISLMSRIREVFKIHMEVAELFNLIDKC